MSERTSGATVAPAGVAGSAGDPDGRPAEVTSPDPGGSHDAYLAQSRMPAILRLPVARAMLVYVLVWLLVGCGAGLLWHLLVHLPSYTVGSDGRATISERGLAAVFSTDAWFSVLGAVLGLLAGGAAWHWFRRVGYPVVLLAMLASQAAGLLCWLVGSALGPRDFDHRLASATSGAVVPIDFTLHASSALLMWPLFAVVPVLLGSALGGENASRRPSRRKRKAAKDTPAVEAEHVTH